LAFAHDFVSSFAADAFVKIIIDHHHRRGATTGQAFHKLHGEFAVRCGL
jgi:hypothetical protein